MVITVHLHTILQRQTPEGPVNRVQVELPAGSRLEDLLATMQIPLPAGAIILVQNGIVVGEEAEISEGDVINLMPAISGGAPGSGD